jgi:hypothetical protein
MLASTTASSESLTVRAVQSAAAWMPCCSTGTGKGTETDSPQQYMCKSDNKMQRRLLLRVLAVSAFCAAVTRVCCAHCACCCSLLLLYHSTRACCCSLLLLFRCTLDDVHSRRHHCLLLLLLNHAHTPGTGRQHTPGQWLLRCVAAGTSGEQSW